MTLYVLSSAIPLICLLSVCMNRTQVEDGTSRPSFKPEHRHIMWRMFFASAVLVSYTGYSYQTGRFLNQATRGKFPDTNTREAWDLRSTRSCRMGCGLGVRSFTKKVEIQDVSCFQGSQRTDEDSDLSTAFKSATERTMSGHFLVKKAGIYHFVVTLEEIVDQEGRTQSIPPRRKFRLTLAVEISHDLGISFFGREFGDGREYHGDCHKGRRTTRSHWRERRYLFTEAVVT